MLAPGLTRTAAVLLATLALAACADDAPPPRADDPAPRLTLAYDVDLNAALSVLLTDWPDDQPRVLFEPDSSSAIAVIAASTLDPPDVLVIDAHTPIPQGANQPISTRRWIADPIVFVARADDPTPIDQRLTDEDTTIALLHESGPLGQYTRFGLRKLNRWELVKDRAARYASSGDLLYAVENDDADLTAVYASELARHAQQSPDHNLAPLQELEVSDASRTAFVVIVMTPEGIDLARWLVEPQQTQALAEFGYRPDAAPTDPR